MIHLIISLAIAYAGSMVEIKGKVSKIENSFAVIVTKDGETKIPLKKLSKANIKKVNSESGSGEEISLLVPPETFK